MKKYYLSFILILFTLVNISAAIEPDSLFQDANKLYGEGKYEESLLLYEKIDSLGFASPEVYFNIGNAYFRSNKIGKARVYYERAKLLQPNDNEINANLEFLNTMLVDRFEEVPEFFLRSWLRKLVLAVHPDNWMILSLILFGGFIIGGILFVFFKKTSIRRSGFYFALISLFIAGIGFLLSYSGFQNISDPGTGIIIEASQMVKSAPRDSGKDLFVLHEGTKLTFENSVENWIEIRISDGRKGWIPVQSMEEI